jgi:uncharacterized protein (TIGR00297 family)
MALSRSEVFRKLTHIAAGGFAFALRDLTWLQGAALAGGAFLFNWLVFPRIGGRRAWREAEHTTGYPLGILLYPLSVLALVLLFRNELWKAAAVWGVLALGDGMASLVGQAAGGPRLFWNPKKSWAGFAAMVVFGAAGCAGLAAWTLRQPVDAGLVGLSLCVALACAWAESLPTTLDDNLTVPLVGAIAIEVLSHADPAHLSPGSLRLALVGLALNAAIAVGAWKARSIDVAGAVSAVVIGTLIVTGFGLRAFALMMVFFVLGSTVTKIGYRIKLARGIAQEKGGARGWRNAWANGGVPAVIAAVGGLAPPDLRPMFLLAYAASVATAAADTCSSEVGKAYGRRTFLITTGRPVPPGTEGAVSLEGTLAAVAGAAAVAFTGAALGLFSIAGALLVTAAGVLGSLAESVVGTLAEKRGWMGNDLLNAFNTAVGAGFVVAMARVFVR